MKKNNSILKNQNGSGLFPVLFVFAMISVAITYLSQNSDETRKSVVVDAKLSSYQNIVNAVKNRLYSETRIDTDANGEPDFDLNCKSIIRRDSAVPAEPVDPNTPVSADVNDLILENEAFTPSGGVDNLGGMRVELDARLAMNPQIIRAPNANNGNNNRNVWFVRGGTAVRDVRLYINERVRAPVVLDEARSATLPDSSDLVAAKGYIIIYPAHEGVGAKKAENRFYRIPIFLYYYMDQQYRLRMHSCFDPTSEAYHCTITGGAYNRETRRCEPQQKCFTDNQGVQANLTCPASPALYNQQVPMGHNGTDPLFSCLWCNQNGIQNELSYLGRARFFGEVWDTRVSAANPFGNFNNLPVASPRNFRGDTAMTVSTVDTCAELSYPPRCHTVQNPAHTLQSGAVPTNLLHAWYRWNADDGDVNPATNYPPSLPTTPNCICRDYEARCLQGTTEIGVSFSGRQCMDAP